MQIPHYRPHKNGHVSLNNGHIHPRSPLRDSYGNYVQMVQIPDYRPYENAHVSKIIILWPQTTFTGLLWKLGTILCKFPIIAHRTMVISSLR